MPRLGCVRDRPAVDVGDPLMTEAHTEHRDLRARNDIRTDPKSAGTTGVPGPGEMTTLSNSSRTADEYSANHWHDDRLAAIHLGEEMEEIERERVSVVDEQRSHPF